MAAAPATTTAPAIETPSPPQPTRRSLFSLVKAGYVRTQRHGLTNLAAQVAYNVLFAVAPLLIFATAVGGLIGRATGTDDAVQQTATWLRGQLPPATATAVLDPIANVIQTQPTGFLSFGFVLALWGAKNAAGAMMGALNVVFEVEDRRPWWRRQLDAIGLTIVLGVAGILASSFLLAGTTLGRRVVSRIGLGAMWTTVWTYLRWPLTVIVVTAALALLYRIGPDVDLPYRWLLPGALLALLLAGAATTALGYYFATFPSYTAAVYGALGGVMAFIFWLYLLALIFLLGGEIGALIARQATGRHPGPLTDCSDGTVRPSKLRPMDVLRLRRPASGAPEPSQAQIPRRAPGWRRAMTAVGAWLATLVAAGAAFGWRHLRHPFGGGSP